MLVSWFWYAYRWVVCSVNIDCAVGGRDDGVNYIFRALCIGQRKDWKLFWCTAMKMYRTGQDPERARNKN